MSQGASTEPGAVIRGEVIVDATGHNAGGFRNEVTVRLDGAWVDIPAAD